MNAANARRSPEVVVVTGASAGVGRAVVREFARERASIGLIARGRDGLEGARREVESAGGRALALLLDVADADAMDWAAERVEREVDPINVWINNAMVLVFSPVKQMTAADYCRVTEVMTAEPEDPNRLDHLDEPVPGDRGTHGRFDGRASPVRQQWWVTKSRGWLAMAGVGLMSFALLTRHTRRIGYPARRTAHWAERGSGTSSTGRRQVVKGQRQDEVEGQEHRALQPV